MAPCTGGKLTPKVNLTDTESKYGLMVLSMRAVLSKVRRMVMAEAFRREERSIRDGSHLILCRVMASTSSMMAEFISANLKMERNQVKECTSLKITGRSMKVNLRRMIVKAKEPCTILTAKNL